jgi:hypothetical protein
MTDETTKWKGGRPPLPPHMPIVDSASCRNAIVRELMGQGRVRQLAALHKLHKAMLAGESQAMESKRVLALEMTARSKSELAAIRRAEYQRRFAAMPIGQQALLKQVESLKERVSELEASINSGSTLPTLEGSQVTSAA